MFLGWFYRFPVGQEIVGRRERNGRCGQYQRLLRYAVERNNSKEMSIKKNIAYNTILTISNIAFPIITTPYVSRILGVKNIGIVNFATTYASYFVLFAALGIPIYGIREIAKHNSNLEDRCQVFSELFLINCLSTATCFLLYLLTVFTIPALYIERKFLLIVGISVLFVPLNTDWFFSGREKFKFITIRSIAAKIISVGGLFIFVRTREDIIPYLALTIVANLSSQIWNFGYMLRKEVKIRFKNLSIKKHLQSVLILFASNIAISIYTVLNTLLLGFMSDYTQVGYYTSAVKISKIILPVVTSMSPVMIARINTLKGVTGNQEQISILLNRSFGFMMLLAVPATVGLIIIAPRFVPFFFGPEFIPAIPSLQLLSLLIIIIGTANFFSSQILLGMGFDKKVLIVVSLGTISSFCLNILLVGPYGSLGASIASVIAELIVLISAVIIVSRVMPVQINTKNIFQPILAALPIIFISFVFNHVIEYNFIYLLSTITASAVFYLMILVLIKNEHAIQMVNNVKELLRKI